MQLDSKLRSRQSLWENCDDVMGGTFIGPSG